MAEELSDLHKKILDIEGQNIMHKGDKERTIQEQTGLSAVRYYQHLNNMRSNPNAWSYAGPTLAAANRRLSQYKQQNPR